MDLTADGRWLQSSRSWALDVARSEIALTALSRASVLGFLPLHDDL